MWADLLSMNWLNLKSNACPQCGKEFNAFSFQIKGVIRCGNCRYTIREHRYAEIVHSQVTKELEEKWNQEEELF